MTQGEKKKTPRKCMVGKMSQEMTCSVGSLGEEGGDSRCNCIYLSISDSEVLQ